MTSEMVIANKVLVDLRLAPVDPKSRKIPYENELITIK